ncbi:MAG: UvrD-helicase domain-containing protein [Bdellovibrionales bacterium]|nr:UvrD-helicase domain-containing protein [Bdellovibrionales bacterium]
MSKPTQSKFTEEQLSAIEHEGGSLLLSAAAGSGKTTVMVERFLGWVNSGIAPESILSVSFTNEAANQLRDRILKRMAERERYADSVVEAVRTSPLISTIHGFCYGVVNEFGSLDGFAPIEKILLKSDWSLVFDEAYRNWRDALAEEDLKTLLSYYTHRTLKPMVEALYFSRFEWQSTAEEEPLPTINRIVLPFVRALSSYLQQQGHYSFYDLEHVALLLMQKHPQVVENLRSRVSAILVDEFQDTSPAQWEILKRLKRPDTFFAVGDPVQSIYRFRGAEVALFNAVGDEIESTGGAKKYLTLNFRSEPGVLDGINALSESLFGSSYTPMRAGLAETNGGTYQILDYVAPDNRGDAASEEAEFVAKNIEAQIRRGAEPKDFAILFRSADRMPLYRDALLAKDIPVSCKQSTPLFHSYDVVDLCQYLRAVNNPLDDRAFSAFLCSSFVGYDFEKLWQFAKDRRSSLFEVALRASPEPLKWFFDWVERGDLDLERSLSALFSGTTYWPEQSPALLAFLSLFQNKRWLVPEAVRAIEVWQTEDLKFENLGNSNANAVRIMTVHGSKGLEFPHVYVVDLARQAPRPLPPFLISEKGVGVRFTRKNQPEENELYQELKAENTQRDLEESKRVLFVALTRAQKSVSLVLARSKKAPPKESWASWVGHS